MIKRQFSRDVKVIRSDNGTELRPLFPFFRKAGIINETSMVRTPQQNARVERKHRHILNVARALRFQSGLPIDFWGECVLTAAHLINRTPTRILDGKTPFELLHNKAPDLSLLRVFGCLAYSKNLTPSDKFDSRSNRCVFVGYPFGKKGWTLFNMATGDFIKSRDVQFIETTFPFRDPIVRHTHSDAFDFDYASLLLDDAFLPSSLSDSSPDEPAVGSEPSPSAASVQESGGWSLMRLVLLIR